MLKSVEPFKAPNPPDNLGETSSLCPLLKQTREKQGLSVDHVCDTLKIRKTYIEAIEAGNFNRLPGMVYTAGFIQSYCKFLKIDPDFVKQALREIDSSRDQLSAPPFKPPTHGAMFSPWLIGASLVISLVLIMSFLAFRSDFLKSKPKITLLESTSLTANPAEFNLEALRESLITFFALDQTWIQLTDDKGKIIETRLLTPGEVYQIPNQPETYLTTGNSQALKVYNGHQALTLPVSEPQTSLPFLAPENPDLLENYPLPQP